MLAYLDSMLLSGSAARRKEVNRERKAWKLLGEMFKENYLLNVSLDSIKEEIKDEEIDCNTCSHCNGRSVYRHRHG
jgi:hypothetical protein